MAERSIILRDAEVRDLVRDGKCVVRRVVKPQPDGVRDRVVDVSEANEWAAREIAKGRFVTAQHAADGSPLIGTAKGVHCHSSMACPLGAHGDVRWVKERFVLTQYFKPVYEAGHTDRDGYHWSSIASDPKGVKWIRADRMRHGQHRLRVRIATVAVDRVDGVWTWVVGLEVANG